MARYTGITLALITCELVDMSEVVVTNCGYADPLCPGRGDIKLPQDRAQASANNLSLAQILPQHGILPQTMVVGSQDNASVSQFKVSMFGFVLVSYSLILSLPQVFAPWNIMARFSAKTSSMDSRSRRRALQGKRRSSTLSHHNFSAKAKPTRTVPPKRSSLTFVYVGNVSIHPAAQCFSCSDHNS
jgi:hypothetical protein